MSKKDDNRHAFGLISTFAVVVVDTKITPTEPCIAVPPRRYYHFGKIMTPWSGPLDNEINRVADMRAAYTTRFIF